MTLTVLEQEFVDTALELIREFPASATLTTTTGGVEDPVSGTVTGATETNTPLTVSTPIEIESRYVDGDVVHASDMIVYVDGDSLGAVVPEQNSRLSIEVKNAAGTVIRTDEYVVIGVFPLQIGNVVAAYGLGLRI